MQMKNIRRALGANLNSGLTRGVNVEKLKEDNAPPKALTPVNAHILDRVKSYAKELPDLLGPIARERDFLLKEVFPPAMTALNAFADAGEVLASTLNGYDISPLGPLYESYAMDAVRSKILCRIINQFNLTGVEVQYFLARVLASEGHSNDRIQTILHEVQSLVDLQRQAKGTEVPMRSVPDTEGSRGRQRVRVPGDDSKGRNGGRSGGGRSVQPEDAEIYRTLQQSRRAGARRTPQSKAPAAGTGRKSKGPTGL